MEHAKLPLDMLKTKKEEGPVTCLGMTFDNDQKRREYFTEILRQKLPELKKIEGYPIGEDEDILTLSDPPYYTACPNPFINDFAKEWEQEKKELYGDDVDEEYRREPFAADVAEGKNDPVYNAHAYHTKVPHKAIMRYILHYTNPGDIIFDGFAGTGMSGVAAADCADPAMVRSLGYSIENERKILDKDDPEFHSSLGKRKAILNDLSPAATLISHAYNGGLSKMEFLEFANKILQDLQDELSWMYETDHDPREYNGSSEQHSTIGKVNYVVWSDVFRCPECSEELVYFDEIIDLTDKVFKDTLDCPNCSLVLKKSDLEKQWETIYDEAIGINLRYLRQVPVLINYSVGSKRFEKKPSKTDFDRLERIQQMKCSYWFPTVEFPQGDKVGEPKRSHGLTHVHQLYTKRNLIVLSATFERVREMNLAPLLTWVTSVMIRTSKMYKFTLDRKMGTVSGTYYIPSLSAERNVLDLLKRKLRDFSKVKPSQNAASVVSTQSTTQLILKDSSVDYIFTDPPFGSNLMYSELNFLWEAWLQVLTNSDKEAIENKTQSKGLSEYQELMIRCFIEYYRVLKSGRWMTVVFSNSQARVWNAIMESLQRAGFVIANVSALNKKQGSFNAVTSTTAVKQDLVISAYKPPVSMIEEIRTKENTAESAWIFVRSHLEKLPVFVGAKGEAELIVERTPRVLFDRMVAYHVQNGYSVPISSAEFQEGVAQRFPMRDGMAFLETQVTEYDKKRLLAKEFIQTTLFVSDENSAIEWLRQRLMQKPQTRQDLHPNFMKELQHISKHELLPELDVLLEQNFLMYDGTGLVPSQIHSYLSTDFKDLRNLEKDDPKLQAKAKNRWYVPDPNKQADLEKLRERSLLREFNSYIEELGKSKKKLRQFRTEAIRAGFKTAWGNQDYQTIVDVGQRLPEKVLQEDSTMLMYYDNAQVRLGM